MRLALSDAEAAFRDELREFFTTQIPAEIRRKLSEGRKLSREDIVTTQRVLHAHGMVTPNRPLELVGKDWSTVQPYTLYDKIQACPVPPTPSLTLHLSLKTPQPGTPT